MNNKNIRAVGTVFVVALWLGLVAFAWFGPTKDRSAAEKRPLAQMPEFSFQTVFGTDATGAHPFMAGFEDFSLDQFPLRDAWRSAKALFHNYILGNRDNNGYYYKDGYLAKQDLVLSQDAVTQKLNILNKLYQSQLATSGGKFYLSLVPDKSYYLSEQYGYPSMDFAHLESQMIQGMPWAEYVDIKGTLELSDYYYTDTHWRQENLIPTAQALANALGVTGPQAGDFTAVKVDKPFYGVYHAQAALPQVKPDEMYVMESELLSSLTIQVAGNANSVPVYDMGKLNSDDQYHIYLSGAKNGMVTVENPNAGNDKHLVIIRDSFGSSIAPLLFQDYSRITLVDLRAIYYGLFAQTNPATGEKYLDFQGADVLVLLSSLAINSDSEVFLG